MTKEKFKLSSYKSVVNDWSKYEPLTPKKSIMAKCLDCCCYNSHEVKLCDIKSCPLFYLKEIYYKNVENPNKRKLTEEQKKEFGERMKNLRDKK